MTQLLTVQDGKVKVSFFPLDRVSGIVLAVGK